MMKWLPRTEVKLRKKNTFLPLAFIEYLLYAIYSDLGTLSTLYLFLPTTLLVFLCVFQETSLIIFMVNTYRLWTGCQEWWVLDLCWTSRWMCWNEHDKWINHHPQLQYGFVPLIILSVTITVVTISVVLKHKLHLTIASGKKRPV